MFITNMIPLHALVLILMGRFSNRLYVAYSSWYAIGTLASMQVPFVGFQPVKTSEHMAALGNYPLAEFFGRPLTRLLSCFWSPTNRCLCPAGAITCLLPTVPKALVHRCGHDRCSGNLRFRRNDLQGMDCPVDWSFLFTVGYRICKKVTTSF